MQRICGCKQTNEKEFTPANLSIKGFIKEYRHLIVKAKGVNSRTTLQRRPDSLGTRDLPQSEAAVTAAAHRDHTAQAWILPPELVGIKVSLGRVFHRQNFSHRAAAERQGSLGDGASWLPLREGGGESIQKIWGSYE